MQLSHDIKEKEVRLSKIYNILISVLVNIPSINSIGIVYFPSVTGRLMSLLYIITCSLLILVTVYWKKGIKIKLYNVFILLYITLAYITTSLSGVVSAVSISQFIVYIVFTLLFFGNVEFNSYTIITTCLLINLPGVFVIDKIFLTNRNAIAMGVSYAYLLPSLCPIAYLIQIQRKKFTYFIISIIELVYLYQIVLHGTRGVVLSICIGLFMISFFSYDMNRRCIKTPSLKISVVAIIVFIGFMNLETLLTFLYNSARSAGLDINFLSKSIRMFKLYDFSNGREEIYAIAINHISDSPIFGHGIGSFEYFTGIVYPHNFILQVVFDLGIIGLIMIIIPFITGCISWFRNCNSESVLSFVILFASAVPGALFSHDLWLNMLLWINISLFIGIIPQNGNISVNIGKRHR